MPPKEWTLMFYFASDNPLAPEIVLQLKALKNAGYHREVNVVAYFDPQSYGPRAHIFDVNAFDKLKDPKPKIGFKPNDPYIRDLMFDKLWGTEVSRDKEPIRELMQELIDNPRVTYNLPELPSHSKGNGHARTRNHANEFATDSGPEKSLKAFLNFCAREYQAEHYMLFILGHGLVVGDDVFLYDEHAAVHSVTLKGLREAVARFKTNIQNNVPGAELELISFHSCSMSSLEVAFELQGTAKYMLASQGPAFVGSWPYRQIVMRVLNDVHGRKNKTAKDIEKMIEKIFDYVYYNSRDFMLAGYSFDVCLSHLSRSKIAAIKKPLKALSNALIDSLDQENEVLTSCILLAHWKSQSYWSENYTDLLDFCFCLSDYCEKFIEAVKNSELSESYEKIKKASDEVRDAFSKNVKVKDAFSNSKGPIIHARFAGPESQHSNGFSIFFPWTRPMGDRPIVDQYRHYKFEVTDWLKFLEKYWGPKTYEESIKDEGSIKRSTMRDSRESEFMRNPENAMPERGSRKERVAMAKEVKRNDLIDDIFNLMFNAEGPLNMSDALMGESKSHPQGSMGDQCTCGSIKNYLRDTRARTERSGKADPAFQASQFAQRSGQKKV